jgi:hypothetical protein
MAMGNRLLSPPEDLLLAAVGVELRQVGVAQQFVAGPFVGPGVGRDQFQDAGLFLWR